MAQDNSFTTPIGSAHVTSNSIANHLAGIAYPLKISFKIIALASQATVTDANGRVLIYTKQKMFKFREHVEIFTDKSKSVLLAEIKANKVIDWSARYNFTESDGTEIGSVGRKGWRSIWKAHYECFNPGDNQSDFSIHEANPWSKVMDSLLGEIPVVGMFTGYFCHPSYIANRTAGGEAMRITKQAAMWEGKFAIEKLGELSPREELNLILSFMMMILLERKRG
ncbi:hypothetical protein [Luteolibacter sp. AS25]|uniref:hypothetical protein n=1 Tax=Luteolibacter sp. AS25 TaxID=3135776 RepID=UPI00398ACE99